MKSDPNAFGRMPNMANTQRGFMNTARGMPPQGPMANAQGVLNMANAQPGFMNTAQGFPAQGPMGSMNPQALLNVAAMQQRGPMPNAQAAQNMAAMQQQRGMAPQGANRQMLAQALMRRFGGR